MKFGKLQDISQVNFELGQPHSYTKQVLPQVATKTPKFYWGCTGWSMKEWVGSIYPAGTKTKDYLSQYAKQFTTIELNTTHYRIPTTETIEQWYKDTDEHFKFAPKIPQIISHSSDLGLSQGVLDHFCKNIVGLGDKLGCSFMQLPPHFGADSLPILKLFLEQFPTDEIPLAIEVRHPSWFENEHSLIPLLNLLHTHHVSTVITDVAGKREVLHLALTTPLAMIRFVGNGLHPTDYTRVDAWVDLLGDWIDQGLEEIYFFSHQPDNILSPQLCIYLLEQIEKKWQLKLPKQTKLLDSGQMSLF